jgi:hypothetical protein
MLPPDQPQIVFEVPCEKDYAFASRRFAGFRGWPYLSFTLASTALQSTPTQQESKQKAKIFSGTIIKNGDSFILSDSASKLAYVLGDAEKASEFVGKKVKVTGTVDVANNTIHVETIQEIA